MSDRVVSWSNGRLRGLCTRLWFAYAPVAALLAVYYGAASLVLDEYDAEIPFDLVQAVFFSNLKIMASTFVCFGAVFAYFSLIRRNQDSALVRIRRWVARQPFIEIALLRFLPVVLLMIPFERTYSAIKVHIPEITPYSWDITLASVDRLIFMGVDPWTVTHWLLPWPAATWAVNAAYIIWFYLVMACLAAAAVMPLDSRLRLTYLLAFFLSWSVGGSLIAVIFSSAGPVYYERLFGDPVFAALFDRLAAQDEIYSLITLTTQELLWQGYVDPDAPAIGISAFPSMHLCNAAGMALFAFRFGRPAGWLLAAFTAIMLVGSVHLGWHYAVDGVAGIALALLFWRVAERFAGWWFERSALWRQAPAEACPEGGPCRPAV